MRVGRIYPLPDISPVIYLESVSTPDNSIVYFSPLSPRQILLPGPAKTLSAKL